MQYLGEHGGAENEREFCEVGKRWNVGDVRSGRHWSIHVERGGEEAEDNAADHEDDGEEAKIGQGVKREEIETLCARRQKCGQGGGGLKREKAYRYKVINN
jgi:hypothetical protein